MNVSQDDGRIVLTAPLPGLEAQNISITVEVRRATITGTKRGRGDYRRQFVQHEWTAGPYSRAIDLPSWVDVRRANATDDNGVLVVILPVAEAATPGQVTLVNVGTAKGQAIRHAGQEFGSRSPG